jgi:hypothetical protein
LLVLGGVYNAAQHVRPFYTQALQLEPEVLERASRELESQATALYSDARKVGRWQALFTAEQINGWLALQLDEFQDRRLPGRIRDPRVAISPELLSLGFRATSGNIDTVVSIDAGIFLTEDGAVAIRLMSVQAGALPLPVMQLADEVAAACQELSLPIRWSREEGQPVAIVELHSDVSTGKHRFYIDALELGDGELYVAGHTEMGESADDTASKTAGHANSICTEIRLNDYELRLTPRNRRSALEVARRQPRNTRSTNAVPSGR